MTTNIKMGMINPGITRPALRYYGGKFRLASWIIGQFPPHVCYVEPFGGAGSLILRKQPAYHDIYNGLDGEVVNFFRILRERGEELIRVIEMTPYSREEQRISFTLSNDDLERARRLYVRAWQSHGGGRSQWKSGWRYQKTTIRGSRLVDNWSNTDLFMGGSRLSKTNPDRK
jgi:DNA adenine methylase